MLNGDLGKDKIRILARHELCLWCILAIELLVLLPFANLWIMIVGAGGTRSLIGVCLRQ